MIQYDSKYANTIYPYCKTEGIHKIEGSCPGLRYKDDPMFKVIQNNPTLLTITGNHHAMHPPCSYYISQAKKLGLNVRERKNKREKSKSKRKSCRCKK